MAALFSREGRGLRRGLTATATLTVRRQGDLDGDVDLFDVLVHQGFVVGNVLCLTP